MSFVGTMVLNAELESMNRILIKVFFLSRWERAVWSAIASSVDLLGSMRIGVGLGFPQ